MTIGVYALVFPNGKFYIGSTVKSFRRRFRSHLRGLLKGSHCNPHMQNLFNVYGKPKFQVLEKCKNPELVVIREQVWMDAQDQKMLVNCGPAIPCPMFGRIASEETRKKLSESHKGNTNMLGKHFSEESKHKMSESHKGKPLSREHIRKMSESLKGRSATNKGVHHSKETRKKMSESMKRAWKRRRSEDMCIQLVW